MTHKFLRDDGWFQPVYPYDITTTGTATTTGFLNFLTAYTTVDIIIPNGSFVVGPTIAQGSSGTWLAMGTLTCITAGNVNITAALNDGTTTFSEVAMATINSASLIAISIHGIATNPAGNLRISAAASGSTSGLIKFNATGASRDSYVMAVRMG